MSPRPRVAVGAVCAISFVLLTVLVALDVTRAVDVAVRDALRPDDVWGPWQVRVDAVVEGLKPVRTAPAFAALVAVVAVARRSWTPVRYALTLLTLTGSAALGVKVALARTDPHHELSSLGSYPSGHTLAVVVCFGGALLLLRTVPGWWEWAVVGSIGALMALSLLVQAAHWFTDVLGGALGGVAALALVAPRGARDDAPTPQPSTTPCVAEHEARPCP